VSHKKTKMKKRTQAFVNSCRWRRCDGVFALLPISIDAGAVRCYNLVTMFLDLFFAR
jgi:hypothetical protein